MQELIKMSIENSKEAIVIVTNHFDQGFEPTIAYANAEFLDLTKHSLDELIGRIPHNLFGIRNNSQLIEEIKAKVRQKQTWRGPICIYDKDDNFQVLHFTIVPIYNFVNEIMYYACFGKKVEDEQEVQHNPTSCKHLNNFVSTIFAPTSYFKDISDQLPSGLWRTDSKLNIVFSNNVAQKTFGLQKDTNFLDNISSADHKDIKSIFKSIKAGQKIGKMSFGIKDKNIWAGCECWPIIEEDKIVGFAGNIQDVTSEQMLLKELQVLGRK